MWQEIIVTATVAATAGLVAWRFYRTLTGKTTGCGGCSSSASCGGSQGNAHARPPSGCGCGQ